MDYRIIDTLDKSLDIDIILSLFVTFWWFVCPSYIHLQLWYISIFLYLYVSDIYLVVLLSLSIFMQAISISLCQGPTQRSRALRGRAGGHPCFDLCNIESVISICQTAPSISRLRFLCSYLGSICLSDLCIHLYQNIRSNIINIILKNQLVRCCYA